MRFDFTSRHIGPNEQDIAKMLSTLKAKTLDDMIEHATPKVIRTTTALDIGAGLSEENLLKRARHLADANQIAKNYIGLGYYGTATPKVILRNILENPGW